MRRTIPEARLTNTIGALPISKDPAETPKQHKDYLSNRAALVANVDILDDSWNWVGVADGIIVGFFQSLGIIKPDYKAVDLGEKKPQPGAGTGSS